MGEISLAVQQVRDFLGSDLREPPALGSPFDVAIGWGAAKDLAPGKGWLALVAIEQLDTIGGKVRYQATLALLLRSAARGDSAEADPAETAVDDLALVYFALPRIASSGTAIETAERGKMVMIFPPRIEPGALVAAYMDFMVTFLK